MRRSRTPGPYDEGSPWKEIVNTYEWVVQQEYLELRKRSAHQPDGYGAGNHRYMNTQHGSRCSEDYKRWVWEKTAYDIDAQARNWMAQEEARRIAALREAEKARLIQEEIQRCAERVMQRKEQERRRIQEEKRIAQEQAKERERAQRRVTERAITVAWKTYEDRWASIAATSEKLQFRTIPWPTLHQPSTPHDIQPADIAQFVLSPMHSNTQTPKERIKEALRRWHPDRFKRILDRVAQTEKEKVEEGVGIIVRCLNDLLSRQSAPQV